MSASTINRRVALQTLVVGLGAAGLGRAILACVEESPNLNGERQNAPPPRAEPTDDDEFVPGQSNPANAGDEVPKVPKQEWESRVKQLEAEQTRLFRAEVFSMVSPGIMVGKERSHVPNASVVDENGRKKVVVVVNHVMGTNGLDAGAPYDAAADADAAAPMDAGADAARDAEAGTPTPVPDAAPLPAHYITTVYLRATVNGTETVVGLWEFASTDPAPPTVKFTLPEGVTSVTPYEWCTLHGLWIGSALTV
jgi:desulfoferrodoxin (superoxide reductase-like protein)